MTGPGSKETDLRQRMKELGRRFLERSAQEVKVLEENLAKVRANDTTAWAEIEHLTHKMYGTGASLGFVRTSTAAGEVEQLAHDPTARDVQRLAAGIAAIKKALESEEA